MDARTLDGTVLTSPGVAMNLERYDVITRPNESYPLAWCKECLDVVIDVELHEIAHKRWESSAK